MEQSDPSVWTGEQPPEWQRDASGVAGPLAGLRLAVKDLFDIKGMMTGAGNPDWHAAQTPAPRTASTVEALMEAGTELVGKTRTDELAYSLNGVNVHYGTPVNPAQPERLPGGSSSGSAIAVVRQEADIGLGTDTGGSIRVPASYNGLYGLRPSWQAVSLEGCVPLAPAFDTAGWMCRDAATLVRVGEVLLPAGAPEQTGRVIHLVPDGLSQRKLRTLEGALVQEGFEVESSVRLETALLGRASRVFRTLQGRDIWRTHGDWIERCRPRLAPDIEARFQWCRGLDVDDERDAERERREIVAYLERLCAGGEYLFALPTVPGAAPLRDTPSDALAGYRETLMGLTALAGLWSSPQLSMPLMDDEARPWGLSLLAAPGQDRRLLAALRPVASER